MFKLFSIFVFLLFAQFKPVSANEQADQRWQYRWSESEPWKAVTSPCSPPNREDRDLLFLKLIRTHTETNSILIKDHSFSFELVNNNVVTNYPNGRKGYLAGYKDFIVNIGSQSEIQFRTRSDAKNHIGFCKGVFLGSESTLKEKLIRESFVPFTSALVCLFLSIFLFFLSRVDLPPKGFLSTSLTAFLLGTWTFSLPNNNFKEFFFSDVAAWLWVDQMSIMLFPSTLIGILVFLTSGSILRITKNLKYLHAIFACASALAIGSGFAEFYQTNFVFNLIVPFTILLIVFEILRKISRSRKEIIALFIGLFCIIIFGVNDLLVGLWIWPENPLLLPVGFVGFSIAMTYSTIIWTEQKKELTKKWELESAQLSAAVDTIQTEAHDVRRPFTFIKMLIDTLQSVKDAQEQKQLLMIAKPEIEQATSSAESLIQELLNLGKPVQLQTTLTSMTSVIEKSLLIVGQAAKEKQVNLLLTLNHKHQLEIDFNKIERVFVNILQNAIEAMPHRAGLTVQTSETESKMNVLLRNTGSFIEIEDLHKIFDKFHTSGKANGTGLGLHISKQFVEAHGGKIECRSKRGASPNENFVEFQITFNCSNFLDSTNLSHQLDRYFSVVKND